ncbi:hypothetical protein F4779DRAFT_611174 [Xylariaceae sp. FL0662B]|nr:hypothetical protein F4779DRAFT_611174 [Xylariaceae sp. FL0662B]
MPPDQKACYYSSSRMNAKKRARLDCDSPSSDQRPNGHVPPKPQMTRACAECKKHKIRCYTQPGQTACQKCLKSSITCVPHNFAQKFMNDDAAWKAEATSTLDQLKAAIEDLLRHNNLPDLSHYTDTISALRSAPAVSIETMSSSATTHSDSAAPGNFISEGPGAGRHEDDSELVPLPMNNLYELTAPGNSRLIRVDPTHVNGPDFISQGVVSVAEAEFLFDHYRCRINPLLWDGILCSHKTLREARRSSSLLVATVLTVAALQIPNREQTLRVTYDAFVSLMRASCLLRSQNLDDIRGLCIGSFYLTSLSWALCSRAVRVATEMNLHKSSLQFARGSLESYERVRLWYVLYVCDHQFALAYGRPPMMHDDAAIRNAENLLTSGLSSKGDRGLVAQVTLFRILARGYFMHGCDPDLELNGEDFEMLQSFNISLDQWKLEYQLKGADPPGENMFPSKGILLYYHLARFQLNSVSLRGISARKGGRDNSGPDMSWDRQEAANNTIAAATSTLRLFVEDGDLRKAHVGMPIFIHAMLAVCASFLLKMAVVFGESSMTSDRTLHLPRDLAKYGLNFHTKNALANVENLVRVLSPVADNASQQHVARHVVTGLKELLQRFSPALDDDSFVYSRSSGTEPSSLATNTLTYSLDTGSSRDTTAQLENSRFARPYTDTPAIQASVETQPAAPLDHQQDPFDLLGDLDWRFNDAFLWGMNDEISYV